MSSILYKMSSVLYFIPIHGVGLSLASTLIQGVHVDRDFIYSPFYKKTCEVSPFQQVQR